MSVEIKFKSDFHKIQNYLQADKHTKIHVTFYVKNFLWDLEV
jgi:hypothetical protein